jgi:DNA polymerase
MKRSDYTRTVQLVKTLLDDSTLAGETEIIGMPVPPPSLSRPAPLPNAAAPHPVPPIPAGGALDAYRTAIASCTQCPLGKTRLNFVFGVGSPLARLLFIGEGPGFDEDHSGEPFVGKAGQLLNKIIESIGYRRQDVYIANVVKCHPMKDPSDPELRGNDRAPSPEEMEACLPYLARQIELINPAVICTLGSVSTGALLRLGTGITRLRGNWHEYNGIKVMPTYHPAALLRNPALKRDVWEDMKKIKAALAG